MTEHTPGQNEELTVVEWQNLSRGVGERAERVANVVIEKLRERGVPPGQDELAAARGLAHLAAMTALDPRVHEALGSSSEDVRLLAEFRMTLAIPADIQPIREGDA